MTDSNAEEKFQETLGIIKVEMKEMDACPKCTPTKACDFHRENALVDNETLESED